MNRVLRTLGIVAVGAGLALSGCKSGTAPAAGTGAAGAGGAPAGGANQVSCVVGTWKLTDLDASVGNGMKLSGGTGVILTMPSSGPSTLDYTPMQPITFTAPNGAAGSFTYSGKATAVLSLTGPGDKGTWQPTGTPDISGVTVTYDITSPTKMRVLDHVSLAGAEGSPGANASVLSRETYECSGNTLRLKPADSSLSGTWTWQRS
jgi:hypothetical protein